ncbi:hypothetical protein [Halorhodospira sp. 9622]|uniref:hypothetical protein n=1 Tax=Halorhodospira sp. 9622 TaxID=2899136 RepID=UPI001EE928D2|nr:hypothetical protein [Halorhodospira sp. 9622]MCG5539098.1 hypothetical protein [Halorhodospira sp. 9622]
MELVANLINPRHPLVLLAGRVDWSVFEQKCTGFFPSTTGRPAALIVSSYHSIKFQKFNNDAKA